MPTRPSRLATMLITSLAVSTSLLAAGSAAAQTTVSLTAQTPLAPSAIPTFVDRLPVLDVTPEPLWAGYPKIATVLPGDIATLDGRPQPFTIRMCEFKANVLPKGTFLPGANTPTTVWGYAKGTCPTTTQETYIGPVFVNVRDTPTPIRFVNDLPSTPAASELVAYWDGVDQTLHWADPDNLMCGMAGMAPDPRCNDPFRGHGVPAVPHLHGGEVPPVLDGGPDAWFTSDGTKHGPTYYTDSRADPRFAAAGNEAVYTYPNTQEAGPLWFHDHTLGATRLNVFAGLAGGYYLLDPNQDIPAGLKDLTQVVPVVLQDRMFDTKGELFFTSGSKGGILWALNPEHPYWNPEFVGDTIVVNGKVWPFLEVQPKPYRFLFLNGSNARTYELFLTNRVTKIKGPSMYVIGTDGGYLDRAVKVDPNAAKPAQQKLVIMPGERYEVVIDFTGQAPGTRLYLKNVGKTPYPGGATPTGGLGQIMELRVACPVGTACPTTEGLAYDPALTPTIRGAGSTITPLVNFATGTTNVKYDEVRQLTLNEVMGAPVTATDPVTGVPTAFPGGPLEILVNNTKWSGASARNDPAQPLAFKGDFVATGTGLLLSELPQEGHTELWEIVNLTADSHPIHLHLVQFQLLNRQAFDLAKYDAAYGALFPPVNGMDGMPLMIGMNTCSGGVFCPGYGPPLDYFTGTPGKLGGNPDVARFLRGAAIPALAQETGWKDTVQVPPGMVTRIVVRFAPTDLPTAAPAASRSYPFDPSDPTSTYVWHCHIIDHEDNEMMRADAVQVNPLSVAPAQRPLVKGTSY